MGTKKKLIPHVSETINGISTLFLFGLKEREALLDPCIVGPSGKSCNAESDTKFAQFLDLFCCFSFFVYGVKLLSIYQKTEISSTGLY